MNVFVLVLWFLRTQSYWLIKYCICGSFASQISHQAKCLVDLHDRAQKAKVNRCEGTVEMEVISRIVFAELVMYIEEVHYHDVERAEVFKLSDLAKLYTIRMEQLGIKLDMRLHTTRLKQCLSAEFIDMKAQKKGHDVLLAFEGDIGSALAKVCELDSDSEAIQLTHAAKFVHNYIFGKAKPFTGFTEGCQKK